MQSKVFWGQMAVQDRESSPLIPEIAGGSSEHYSSAYCNFAMHSEDTGESLRESDASDVNVTAIRVNEIERVVHDVSFERKCSRQDNVDQSR